MIGYDYFHGVPELLTTPSGWTAVGGLPINNARSPTGWNVNVVPTEDTTNRTVVWTVIDASSGIQPGQSVGGFAILVPSVDASYETSHWTASLNGPVLSPEALSGTLTPDTTCPTPRLSVTLVPNSLWPPNHDMDLVRALISAQDGVDGTPGIKLVSITANETIDASDVTAQIGTDDRILFLRSERSGQDKEGRIYTVTYSAANSCGNTVTASATVTVPHDQR
jgi:hypothetical protein